MEAALWDSASGPRDRLRLAASYTERGPRLRRRRIDPHFSTLAKPNSHSIERSMLAELRELRQQRPSIALNQNAWRNSFGRPKISPAIQFLRAHAQARWPGFQTSLRRLFAQDPARQFFAVREHQFADHSNRISLLAGDDGDCDFVSCVQRFAGPPGSLHNGGRIRFNRPCNDVPFFVLRIEEYLAVRIIPVKFLHGPLQRHRMLRVIVRSSMVREGRSGRHPKASNQQNETQSPLPSHITPLAASLAHLIPK